MTIRPVLLWGLVGAWSVLFGPPGLPSRALIAISSHELALAKTAVESLLLASAVVVSVSHSLARPTWTLSSVAGATGALALYCIVVGMLVYMDGQLIRLGSSTRLRGFLESGLESGKLERIDELTNPKSGRILASIIYRESGLRLSYRSKDGAPILFEPDAEDERRRSKERDLQRTDASLRAGFERHAEFLRTAAMIHLGTLPTVAFVHLLLLRRRRATVTP